MNYASVKLVSTEAKLILEALLELDDKWALICENSEDEVAEIGNDLIELRLLIASIKGQVIPAFGNEVLNFSRTAL